MAGEDSVFNAVVDFPDTVIFEMLWILVSRINRLFDSQDILLETLGRLVVPTEVELQCESTQETANGQEEDHRSGDG